MISNSLIHAHLGFLKKIDSKGRQVEYQFFLFNDVLLYGKAAGSKCKVHRTIHLSLCRMLEEPRGFKIVTPLKTITVQTSSSEEHQQVCRYLLGVACLLPGRLVWLAWTLLGLSEG